MTAQPSGYVFAGWHVAGAKSSSHLRNSVRSKLTNFLEYWMKESRHAWGWSDERRARQSAAIHSWSPWTKSTGPVTEDGKRASPRNKAMPGSLRYELLQIRAELERVLRQVKEIAARKR
jgi:hypothetical protein